jgi:hypothetical protein
MPGGRPGTKWMWVSAPLMPINSVLPAWSMDKGASTKETAPARGTLRPSWGRVGVWGRDTQNQRGSPRVVPGLMTLCLLAHATKN